MFKPAFSKQAIADLNVRFTTVINDRFHHAQQMAFEEGAFLALEAIERVSGKRQMATLADYARLEELVGGDRA